MSDMRIAIRINADGTAAVTGIQRVESELGRMDTAGRKAAGGLDAVAGKAAAVGTAVAATAATVLAFSKVVGTAGDNLKLFDVQMTRLSGSSQGFIQVARLADQLGIKLDDAAQAANFFSPTFTKLGKSFQDSTAFIADLNQSLQLFGVKGSMAASVVQQLAQGFSAGVLQGDELKSLSENAAGLYVELEKAVQAIVGSSGPLKQLGSDGKITSEVLYQAFAKVFDGIRGEFAKIPNTIEKEENRVGNAWDQLLANLDKKTKASSWWQSLMVEWRKTLEGASNLLVGTTVRPNQGFSFDAGSQQQSVDALLAELDRRREIILKTQGYLDGMNGPEKLSERAMEYQRTIVTETAAMDELGRTLNVLLGIREREIKANATAGDSYAALTANLREMEKESKVIPTGVMSAIKQIETGKSLDVTKTNPSSGAFGLWQFMPDTAKAYGYGNTVKSQTEAAVKYVQDSIAKGGDSLENIFSSYVAGSGWKTSKRSEKAESYRQWYVAEATRIYKEWLQANAVGNAEAQKQLGAIEKDEGSAYARRLKAEQDFAAQRAALIAERQNREAQIEADYASKIAAAKGNKDASPGAIADTVAELERTKAFEIAKARADAAKQEADAAKETRSAMADKLQVSKDAQGVYDSLMQPQRDYIERMKAEGAQAGLTSLQVAKLSAEMDLNRQIAEAYAKQKDLAWDAAQEARKTGEPVDMSKADAAGAAADELKRQKESVLGMVEATAKVKETTKKTLPTIEEMWAETVKNVSKGIQGDLSNAFEGLFNGTLKSADDFMDALKKTIVGGLAKLASAVLMQPINIAINTLLSGSTSTGGSAGGSLVSGLGQLFSGGSGTGGGAGGSSFLSSLSSLFGGNSIGASIAGGLYSRFSPTSGGSLTLAGQLGTAAYSLPNWAFGAAGLAGGLGGQLLFPNSPYASLGGSLGSTGGLIGGQALGTSLGLSGALAGSVVPVIGTILGGLLGAFGGSLLGGGKDTTPEKEAILKAQYEYKTGLDNEKQNEQIAISQIAARDDANTAAIAAQYEAALQANLARERERLTKIAEERASLETNLNTLLRGEAYARELAVSQLDASNRATAKLADAMSDLKSAATALQSRYQQLADTIQDWATNTLNSLFVSTETSAREQYQTQLAAARAGDQDAMAGLTGYADRYLAAAKTDSATRADYLRAAARVLGEVSGVGVQAQNAADRLADITGQTNQTLQQQYALALKSAQEAQAYYVASGQYNQSILDGILALHLDTRSTTGYASGGIASGPTSGYPVTLHGTEAIIPLGKGAVPVAISWDGMIAEIRAMGDEIKALRGDQQRQHHASYIQQRETADTLRRWEAIGQPEVRTA